MRRGFLRHGQRVRRCHGGDDEFRRGAQRLHRGLRRDAGAGGVSFSAAWRGGVGELQVPGADGRHTALVLEPGAENLADLAVADEADVADVHEFAVDPFVTAAEFLRARSRRSSADVGASVHPAARANCLARPG